MTDATPHPLPNPPADDERDPVLPAADAADIGGVFDPAGVVWTKVSSRLTTVRVVAASLILLVPFVVFVLLAALADQTWAGFAAAGVVALLAWVLWLVPRQVGAIGYAERAEDLLVRRGVMFRSLVVVPYGRMQLVDVDAGPIARSLGLANVQLHTASATSDASIPGLPAEQAAQLRDRLAARGEARMAGL